MLGLLRTADPEFGAGDGDAISGQKAQQPAGEVFDPAGPADGPGEHRPELLPPARLRASLPVERSGRVSQTVAPLHTNR